MSGKEEQEANVVEEEKPEKVPNFNNLEFQIESILSQKLEHLNELEKNIKSDEKFLISSHKKLNRLKDLLDKCLVETLDIQRKLKEESKAKKDKKRNMESKRDVKKGAHKKREDKAKSNAKPKRNEPRISKVGPRRGGEANGGPAKAGRAEKRKDAKKGARDTDKKDRGRKKRMTVHAKKLGRGPGQPSKGSVDKKRSKKEKSQKRIGSKRQGAGKRGGRQGQRPAKKGKSGAKKDKDNDKSNVKEQPEEKREPEHPEEEVREQKREEEAQAEAPKEENGEKGEKGEKEENEEKTDNNEKEVKEEKKDEEEKGESQPEEAEDQAEEADSAQVAVTPEKVKLVLDLFPSCKGNIDESTIEPSMGHFIDQLENELKSTEEEISAMKAQNEQLEAESSKLKDEKFAKSDSMTEHLKGISDEMVQTFKDLESPGDLKLDPVLLIFGAFTLQSPIWGQEPNAVFYAKIPGLLEEYTDAYEDVEVRAVPDHEIFAIERYLKGQPGIFDDWEQMKERSELAYKLGMIVVEMLKEAGLGPFVSQIDPESDSDERSQARRLGWLMRKSELLPDWLSQLK